MLWARLGLDESDRNQLYAFIPSGIDPNATYEARKDALKRPKSVYAHHAESSPLFQLGAMDTFQVIDVADVANGDQKRPWAQVKAYSMDSTDEGQQGWVKMYTKKGKINIFPAEIAFAKLKEYISGMKPGARGSIRDFAPRNAANSVKGAAALESRDSLWTRNRERDKQREQDLVETQDNLKQAIRKHKELQKKFDTDLAAKAKESVLQRFETAKVEKNLKIQVVVAKKLQIHKIHLDDELTQTKKKKKAAEGREKAVTEKLTAATKQAATEKKKAETAEGREKAVTEKLTAATKQAATEKKKKKAAEGREKAVTEKLTAATKQAATEKKKAETAEGREKAVTEKLTAATKQAATEKKKKKAAEGRERAVTEKLTAATKQAATEKKKAETAEGRERAVTEKLTAATKQAATEKKKAETAEGRERAVTEKLTAATKQAATEKKKAERLEQEVVKLKAQKVRTSVSSPSLGDTQGQSNEAGGPSVSKEDFDSDFDGFDDSTTDDLQSPGEL
jgi:hypothetical protein